MGSWGPRVERKEKASQGLTHTGNERVLLEHGAQVSIPVFCMVEETSHHPDHSFFFGHSFLSEVLASEPDMDHFYTLDCLSTRCQVFFAIVSSAPLGDQQCQECMARFSPTTSLGFDPSPGAFSGSFEEL